MFYLYREANKKRTYYNEKSINFDMEIEFATGFNELEKVNRIARELNCPYYELYDLGVIELNYKINVFNTPYMLEGVWENKENAANICITLNKIIGKTLFVFKEIIKSDKKISEVREPIFT